MKKKTGNLVALGSAAVVAVYGAGFMRTAAAAERFAAESNERVLSPAETEVIAAAANGVSAGATSSGATEIEKPPTPEVATKGKIDLTTAQPPSAEPLKATASGNDSKVGATDAKRSDAAPGRKSVSSQPTSHADSAATVSDSKVASATAAPVATASLNSSASSVTAASTTTISTPSATANAPVSAVTSTATPAVSTTPAVTPAVTPTATPTVTPAATPAPTPAGPPAASPASTSESAPPTSGEAKPALKWKDGAYTGYGRSRHGDIEVYLETEGGKISYVKISQCLTQYSCSWISDLPGQVLARQGPQVDAPSGATQSANAFYYAVVQALAKAK